MKSITLVSLVSLLLAVPACNWRGRCVSPCAQPCPPTCSAPCATSCNEPCQTTCTTETVREVPLTYSAPMTGSECAPVYRQAEVPSYQSRLENHTPPAVRDADIDRTMNGRRPNTYDMSDMK